MDSTGAGMAPSKCNWPAAATASISRWKTMGPALNWVRPVAFHPGSASSSGSPANSAGHSRCSVPPGRDASSASQEPATCCIDIHAMMPAMLTLPGPREWPRPLCSPHEPSAVCRDDAPCSVLLVEDDFIVAGELEY